MLQLKAELGQSAGTLHAGIEVNRQLLALQQLSGQSSARLSQFAADLEARQNAVLASGMDTTADGSLVVGQPSAEQMYQAAQSQLSQGSMTTARAAFNQLLATHPLSPRASDAMYGIAETFYRSAPDSAMAYYRDVASNFPESARAPAALYKLGSMAADAGDLAAAKQWFERVATARYRGTAEYDLALDRLRRLP